MPSTSRFSLLPWLHGYTLPFRVNPPILFPRNRRLKDEDTIYTERVEGYSKSLKDDALREVREKEEEAERARLEEEEKKAQEVREAKEREDVER